MVLAEILALPGVTEDCVLRSRVGFMALSDRVQRHAIRRRIH
jgi:hypothetical protein